MLNRSASTVKDAINPNYSAVDLEEAIRVNRSSSAKAASWLAERITRGEPAYSEQRNSWWRVPWALALSGERAAAVSVLVWAERFALTDDGDLKPPPYAVDLVRSPVYQLTHLGIAAHLTDRYDLSRKLLAGSLQFWNHDTGGAYTYRDRRNGETDWLLTSQVGLLAALVGDEKIRDQAYGWFRQMWEWQPRLHEQILVTGRNERGLLMTPLPDLRMNINVVDLTKPQQMYFQPGAAAAFLAEYAAQTGDAGAIEMARELLMLNVEGTSLQVTDPSSVHACKFPWGAAELSFLDKEFDWVPYLLLFTDWFSDRQEESGAWSPSAFTLAGPATDADRMWKTAEHLMEVQKINAALFARLVNKPLK